MKASETKLQNIIEGTKQYVVPLFQRTYSWDKKQWQDLLDDLRELCEEETRTHFLGSIVTMPTNSVPEGVQKYLLIDGQQRLTTIFILLALIRDISKKDDQEELAAEINNTLLANPYKKDLDYYKLLPTHTDRATFQRLIKSLEILPLVGMAKDQIQEAYSFFERQFRDNKIDPAKLKKVISSNLSVVSIVLDVDDDPHLVFESLNAKGNPLTQADLIRNYFFMKIHVNDQENIYKEYWKPMQDSLADKLTEFIRHFLMKSGLIVKESNVYFELKERIAKGNALEGSALELLKDLSGFAKFYEKLLYPQKEPDLTVRELLTRLNHIEVTTAYPFLLNCYNDYQNKKLSVEDFTEVLKILENFMIRRFVCNKPSNQLNKIFPILYKQTYEAEKGSFVEGLGEVLQTKGYPKDAEFRQNLVEGSLYGASSRIVKTKLILEVLEKSYAHKELLSFDNLTIEHVMPQKLNETWQKYLGQSATEVHELLLHTLGNLTLTAYNSELGDSDFDAKKQRLLQSHVELNKYFHDKTTWYKEDIQERSHHLTEQALKIWPYFGKEITRSEVKSKGQKPKRLIILGQAIVVDSWRDVLEQTLLIIAELEPKKFNEIIQQFPNYIGLEKTKFRDAREIKSGIFIEVNLSSDQIKSICNQMLNVIGLTTADWQIEMV